jgi:hypothetical protein
MAQRPPGSPLDQYLPHSIDPPDNRLSENFAQPLNSLVAGLVALAAWRRQRDSSVLVNETKQYEQGECDGE